MSIFVGKRRTTNMDNVDESWHGGIFGKKGGCFLSMQKWLNGVPPSFVGHDWSQVKNNITGTASLIED